MTLHNPHRTTQILHINNQFWDAQALWSTSPKAPLCTWRDLPDLCHRG